MSIGQWGKEHSTSVEPGVAGEGIHTSIVGSRLASSQREMV
jgi:hypothetical protein